MALADVAALAQDVAFKGRLKAAMVDGAVDALAGTPGPRLGRFAASVLHQLDAIAERLAWGVASALVEGGATIPPTDAQIRQALQAVWSAYAGYEP